jgi:hypothetical protein
VEAGTGEEVSRGDLVKGFAIGKNEYGLLEPEDFEKVKRPVAAPIVPLRPLRLIAGASHHVEGLPLSRDRAVGDAWHEYPTAAGRSTRAGPTPKSSSTNCARTSLRQRPRSATCSTSTRAGTASTPKP